MNALAQFVEDWRAVPGAEEVADDLCDWFASQNNVEFVQALEWIAGQHSYSLVARLDAIHRLVHLPSPVTVSMRELMAKQ